MPTTFANSINSNPIYAARAEADAAGNLISSTYATKAELPEGVPTVTSSDDGKVLQASYSGGTGSVSWVTPSGGGSSEVIGAFTYQDRATSEVINKVIIGSSTSNEYKTLVGTGSYSDDLFGAQSFSAQTGFVSGSTLVWINPQGQDWGNLFSVNSIFGLGEFRTMTGTDSTQLSFDHPVPGWFKGQGRLVQFASNQESNSVIWEAQFDMPEFDNGSYTWYYNKAYTCKVTKVNGTFTSGYGLLFVIVNGEDAPDFYEHNLSYISDYILTGNYLYGYSGNAIIHACKNITLDKVNGVPNTSGYSQGDVLTIDSNGGAVWATPSGGNGIDSVVAPMLKTTPDGKTVTGALGCSFVYSQSSGNIPLINGYGNSYRFYIGDPWHQEWISSTGAKTINICSATGSIGTQVAWVPADTTWTSGKPARYLLDKTASFQDGPIGSPYYIWRSTGAEQVANFYRIITVNVPTSATGPFDTAIFDVVGDWSNITTPISEWTIGFTTDSGVTFTGIDGQPTAASTNVSMQLHKVYEVKRADSSLSLNSLTGLYVTNPLPSSTSSDQDKVLTVNSSGAPVWATPSSGGGDVFVATYGTTTYSDVQTAYNAGKVLFVKASNGAVMGVFNMYVGLNTFVFYMMTLNEDQDTIDFIKMTLDNSDNWNSVIGTASVTIS
jgi:hypothetical protein